MAISSFSTDSYPDKYWATVTPDELVRVLDEKEKKYHKYLRASEYWHRVLRNLSYFHGMFFDSKGADAIDMELKLIGDESEYIGFAVNHFRNLLEHIFQLAARDKVAVKCKAVNSDNRSLQGAKIGDGVLEYYEREKEIEDYVRAAAIHCLIFAHAFVHHYWDPMNGDSDAVTGAPSGDISLGSPTVESVVWDLSRDWKKSDWCIVEIKENKWDLVSRFPEHRDDILKVIPDRHTRINLYKNSLELCDEDLIDTKIFYHKKKPSVKSGRMLYYVKDRWLTDTELPYESLPLSIIKPGEWISQGSGWTPAFSLQAPQEMLNGELSAIASNHAAFATQDMYLPQGQEKLKVTRLKGGLRIISGPVKPEGLSLLATPPEAFKLVQDLIQHMQLVSGITGATRGVPEAGVTAASGLALLDAKSVQFSTSFVHSYNRLVENTYTFIVKMLSKFTRSEKTITISGKSNLPYLKTYSGKDLSTIDRVVVEMVNPISRTIAGRDARAKDLIAMGAIKTPEEYIQVQETGRLEPLLAFDNAVLNRIREENEVLGRGEPVRAMKIDNQILHIKEHSTLLCTQSNINDPEIVSNVLAHIKEHQMLLQLKSTQRLQIDLGFAVPPTYLAEMINDDPAEGFMTNPQLASPMGPQQGMPQGMPQQMSPGSGRIPMQSLPSQQKEPVVREAKPAQPPKIAGPY